MATIPTKAAPAVIKPSKAAALADKNSRTMVKIMQLQEYLTEKGDTPKDRALHRKICIEDYYYLDSIICNLYL